MKFLTGQIIGLHFMRHKSLFIDNTHGLIEVPHLTLKIKTAAREPSAKHQAFRIHDILTIPPMTTKTITTSVDHPSEWSTIGTVTSVGKFGEAVSVLLSHSMSTIFGRKIAVRVTKTTESPFSIRKNTQSSKFSVVTPE